MKKILFIFVILTILVAYGTVYGKYFFDTDKKSIFSLGEHYVKTGTLESVNAAESFFILNTQDLYKDQTTSIKLYFNEQTDVEELRPKEKDSVLMFEKKVPRDMDALKPGDTIQVYFNVKNKKLEAFKIRFGSNFF